MRPETRAANVSMSHVSPGLNVSLSQCLARSLVSGLGSPPCLRQWHATRSSSSRAKPSCRARAVRAPMSGECSAHGKALPKTRRPQTRPAKAPRLAQLFSAPPAAGQARVVQRGSSIQNAYKAHTIFRKSFDSLRGFAGQGDMVRCSRQDMECTLL